MRIWILGSGSRGNTLVVESGHDRILVDAGFPARTLAKRMQSVGVEPESIAHCLVTHEHQDHCRGAGVAARRWGWELHATAGTLAACPDLAGATLSVVSAGTPMRFGALEVTALRTPHDAAESIALHIMATTTGVRAGLAYDLGSVPESLCTALADVDILVAESNHDMAMLRNGPYPRVVQDRIASRTGHLNNQASGEFVRRCVGRRGASVVLAHISEKCNAPAVAHAAVSDALRGERFRGSLAVAAQDHVIGPVEPGSRRWTPGAGAAAGVGVGAPRQLEFGL